MHSVRPELRLQADCAELLPLAALAAPPGTRTRGADVPAREDLQSRLICPDLHGDLVGTHQAGRQHLAAVLVQTIVPVDEASRVHRLLQEPRPPQVQMSSLNRRQLTCDGQTLVRGGGSRGWHHEDMVQHVTGLMTLEIPVGMVRHAQERGRVRDAFVPKVQLPFAHLVDDAHLHFARVAHSTIRLCQSQPHLLLRHLRHLEDLGVEALGTSV
mmetsp:Transcript_117003/g.277918  ORF Transcript_117003/g.277918 Transcript_117003/m.277918 type:complete len:213 (+) Transcript_117003:104-742(+)